MQPEIFVYQKLRANATLWTLTQGNIYPGIPPQDTLPPCMAFNRVDTDASVHDVEKSTIVVHAWADTLADLSTMWSLTKTALNEQRSTSIQRCFYRDCKWKGELWTTATGAVVVLHGEFFFEVWDV